MPAPLGCTKSAPPLDFTTIVDNANEQMHNFMTAIVCFGIAFKSESHSNACHNLFAVIVKRIYINYQNGETPTSEMKNPYLKSDLADCSCMPSAMMSSDDFSHFGQSIFISRLNVFSNRMPKIICGELFIYIFPIASLYVYQKESALKCFRRRNFGSYPICSVFFCVFLMKRTAFVFRSISLLHEAAAKNCAIFGRSSIVVLSVL